VIGEGKAKAPRSAGPKVDGGSPEARRVTAAILEVLAGAVTPTDAARALGVSVGRYYQLECRALSGMVAGCEPRTKGPGRSLERELAALAREHERTKRELLRTQALARAAQRAVGLSALHAPKKPGGKPGKRHHKPVVRAMRAAERLKSSVTEPAIGAAARSENLAGAMAAGE